MVREYMVVSFGTSKKTGAIYSRALRVKSGQNGSYAYLDEKDQYYLDETRPLGSVVKVDMAEV